MLAVVLRHAHPLEVNLEAKASTIPLTKFRPGGPIGHQGGRTFDDAARPSYGAKVAKLLWDLRASLTAVSFVLVSACGGAASDNGKGGDGDGDTGPSSGGDGSGATNSGGATASGGWGGDAAGGSSAGGISSGGEVGVGGDNSGAGGSGGDGSGGDSACSVVTAGPQLAGRARSAGFSGSDAQYSELYSQPCVVASDCDAPCLERGGTESFCGAHLCIDSEPDYCLPPTKWRSLPGALTVETTKDDAAVTSLDISNGDDHDLLLLDEFGFEIPEDATIVGIVASIRKAKDVTDLVTDHRVSLLRAGEIGQEDYASEEEWPTELTKVEYGNSEDVWAEEWSALDINDPGFGVAFGALPGGNGGRAYVDAATITVYYRPPCANP